MQLFINAGFSMAVRFSTQESLENFLKNNYSDPEELRIIRETLERLRNEYSAQTTPAEDNPELIIATSALCTERTPLLKKLCEDPKNNRILLDQDVIRQALPLFTNTIEKCCDEGMTTQEADKIAFGKYRNASLYIYHSLVSHFCERDHNVALSFTANSFSSGGPEEMVRQAQEDGHACEVIVINAPYNKLLESAEARKETTEKLVSTEYIDANYQRLPEVALSILENDFSCSFYWHPQGQEEPTFVLRKNQNDMLTIEDEEAYEDFLGNMPPREREAFEMEVEKRLDLQGSPEPSPFDPGLD